MCIMDLYNGMDLSKNITIVLKLIGIVIISQTYTQFNCQNIHFLVIKCIDNAYV